MITDSSASPTDNASAIAQLLTQFPKGFAVDPTGVLTARDAVKITGGKQLADLARAPKTLTLELRGQEVEIEVRVLSDREVQDIDLLAPSPTPPVKMKVEAGKKVPDGYDRQDPKYIEACEKTYGLKRAVSIARAVPVLEVAAGTAEEMSKQLEIYPPNVLDALYAATRALSVDAVARASFL